MYASYESSIAIPNLLVFNPVDIYGWVLGSMSGLTRIEIFALTPTSFETLLIATSLSKNSDFSSLSLSLLMLSPTL